jgi:hypothetical protein
MGVKYTNNEAYLDLIEEIDAIIDRNGATVMCEIQGYVSETAACGKYQNGQTIEQSVLSGNETVFFVH